MSDIKKGVRLIVGEVPYKIVEFQHVKPGKGAAFVRMKMKSFLNGKVVEKTVHAGDKFEVPVIEYKTMQYLYDDGEMYQFMDNETYDQLGLEYAQCDEASKWFKDGINVEIVFFKNKAISVQAPEFMELIVTDTIPLKKTCSKIKVVSCAPLFADVMKKVHSNTSISGKFLM